MSGRRDEIRIERGKEKGGGSRLKRMEWKEAEEMVHS